MTRATATSIIVAALTLGLIASPVTAAGTAQTTTADDCLEGCLEDPSADGEGPPVFVPEPEQESGPEVAAQTPPSDGKTFATRVRKAFGQTDTFLKAKKAFLKAKKAFVTNPDTMLPADRPDWVPGGGVALDPTNPVAVMPGDRVDVGGISVVPGEHVSIGERTVAGPDGGAQDSGDEPADPSLEPA